MAVASLFEELLDQYKIEQRLAEKRYTELYRAYDVDDDRLVRLDIVRPGLAEDNAFAGRFVNRARAVTQLRHPNIAPIYHIGKTADGRPYVAQAYIDGIPLTQRLEELARRETQVNALYALKLVRQLADALVLAERLELLHHDLQPDNVWLKNVALPSDESLILLDLFIPADRRPPPVGRPRYLSPARAAGRARGQRCRPRLLIGRAALPAVEPATARRAGNVAGGVARAAEGAVVVVGACPSGAEPANL